jgi:hypothetical protein
MNHKSPGQQLGQARDFNGVKKDQAYNEVSSEKVIMDTSCKDKLKNTENISGERQKLKVSPFIRNGACIIIGASNTKLIKPEKIFHSKNSRRIPAFTIAEAQETIDNIPIEKAPSCILFHVGTNDMLVSRGAADLAGQYDKLLIETLDKFPD